MQLAAQLPNDKKEAEAVLDVLGDLVRDWLYQPQLSGALAPANNVVSLMDRAERREADKHALARCAPAVCKATKESREAGIDRPASSFWGPKRKIPPV